MTQRTFNGVTYKYFVDAQATTDESANKAPDAGTLLVACPVCGIDTKPLGAKYKQNGLPQCIKTKK